MKRLEFRIEPWEAVESEIFRLLALHWDEVGPDRDQGVKFDANHDLYRNLEAAQILQAVCARDERGELCGYHTSVLTPGLHSRSTPSAYTDVYYIKRECRSLKSALDLIRKAEVGWLDHGIRRAFMGTSVERDISPLLMRLGYRLLEHNFSKVF